MASVPSIPSAPPPEIRFRRKVSVTASTRELWRSRALIRTLAERDLRARYKQTSLGFAWAIVPPIGMLVVFTVFVKRIGNVFTEGVPYELYAYVGLVAWGFFSGAIGGAGQSLVSNMSLMNKVYCPREVFPLAGIVTALVDAGMSALVIVGLFVIHGYWPKPTTIWVPVILLVQVAATTGATLLTAIAIVYLRDLRHALGIILQIGLFATPVAYSLSAIPIEWRSAYCFVNPIAGVIDSYRQTVLLGHAPTWSAFGPSAASSVLLLAVGWAVFKKLETGVADVA
jgi:ABC-2 type transport system permease protein/lipopolysaccharide transport system permease protein